MRKFWQELPRVDVRYITQAAESKAPGCAELVLWVVVVVGLFLLVTGVRL